MAGSPDFAQPILQNLPTGGPGTENFWDDEALVNGVWNGLLARSFPGTPLPPAGRVPKVHIIARGPSHDGCSTIPGRPSGLRSRQPFHHAFASTVLRGQALWRNRQLGNRNYESQVLSISDINHKNEIMEVRLTI
jgi:hypothetical protein